MRLGEARGLPDERLERLPRRLELAGGDLDEGELVAGTGIPRPQGERLLHVRAGLVVLRVLAQEQAEEQVRVEVVRVDRELAAQRLHGPRRVAHLHEHLAQGGVRGRQGRVQLEGAAQLLLGGEVVGRFAARDREDEVGLRRVALPEDAVEDTLAALRLAVAHEGGPDHVQDGLVLGVPLEERVEDRDHPLPVAELQLAVGEEQRGGRVVGLLLQDRLELRRRVVDPARLVEGDRQVVAHRHRVGTHREGLAVLLDGFLEPPELRVDDPQVRPCLPALRRELQEAAVLRSGGLELPLLLQLDGAGGDRPRGLGLRRRRAGGGHLGHDEQERESDDHVPHCRAV